MFVPSNVVAIIVDGPVEVKKTGRGKGVINLDLLPTTIDIERIKAAMIGVGWIYGTPESSRVETLVQFKSHERAVSFQRLLESDSTVEVRFVYQCYKYFPSFLGISGTPHYDCDPTYPDNRESEHLIYLHIGQGAGYITLADYLNKK